MDYSDILRRLDKLRPGRRAHTWRACCPAHDDRHPSLFLQISPRGLLMARCHAGCDFREIARVLGTRLQDWFPPEEQEQFVSKTQQGYAFVVAYDYRDAAGNLAYQVV